MFDYAQAAVEGALAAGATYADARAMVVRQQGLSCLNENIEGLDYDESAGVGVFTRPRTKACPISVARSIFPLPIAQRLP